MKLRLVSIKLGDTVVFGGDSIRGPRDFIEKRRDQIGSPPRARRWYSPAEVAKTIGVTRHTVERWIREGKLTAIRPHPNQRWVKVTAEALEEAARGGKLQALTKGWLRSGMGRDGAS